MRLIASGLPAPVTFATINGCASPSKGSGVVIEALRALRGSELIVHAGDVGDPEILDRLRELAPLVAVRGNVDMAEWAAALPITAVAEAGSVQIYVLHDVKALDLKPGQYTLRLGVLDRTANLIGTLSTPLNVP